MFRKKKPSKKRKKNPKNQKQKITIQETFFSPRENGCISFLIFLFIFSEIQNQEKIAVGSKGFVLSQTGTFFSVHSNPRHVSGLNG